RSPIARRPSTLTRRRPRVPFRAHNGREQSRIGFRGVMAEAKGAAGAGAAGALHRYRSHTCGALRKNDVGRTTRLCGWVHRVRDHGGLLFIDLRDHYGITQVAADPDSPAFKAAEKVRSEWVIRIDGKVRDRPVIDGKSTVNPNLATGEIEVVA